MYPAEPVEEDSKSKGTESELSPLYLRASLLELMHQCKAVICCRVSPLQVQYHA